MHDLIIIGGGPAGLSAAIYAARFKLDTLVIAKEVGGLIMTTNLIENWPGKKKTSGLALMKNIEEHAKSLGVPIITDEVISIKKLTTLRNGFRVKAKQKNYECRALILATGTKRRKLNVPGEKKYYGRGVSYCATCDAPLFKDKVIGVVGGSDSAAKEALLSAEYAKKVYIIYRRERIRAEPIIAERVYKNKKIKIINNANVLKIKGNGLMNKVILDNPKGKKLLLNGLFIEIGHVPQTELAESIGCKLNKKREIIINRSSRTNIPFVYAAGDCADAHYKQGITGAAEGVIAAFSAYDDLRKSDSS